MDYFQAIKLLSCYKNFCVYYCAIKLIVAIKLLNCFYNYCVFKLLSSSCATFVIKILSKYNILF